MEEGFQTVGEEMARNTLYREKNYRKVNARTRDLSEEERA